MQELKQNFIIAARPKTLLITCGPVFLGLSMAIREGVMIQAIALLCFISALLIQIGTNYANDYFDGLKGTDKNRGNRMVGSGKISASQMKIAFITAFLLAALCGAFLIVRGGWPILAIGLSGIFFGWLYTGSRFSLAYNGWAEPIAFAYFGPLAVAGTYYLQHLSWSPWAWVLGIGPGCFSIIILCLNNLRDFKEDQKNNKNTLVVRFGQKFGNILIIASWMLALGIPVLVMFITQDHPWLISSQIIGILALPLLKQLPLKQPNYDELIAKTGRLLLLYCLLVGLAW